MGRTILSVFGDCADDGQGCPSYLRLRYQPEHPPNVSSPVPPAVDSVDPHSPHEHQLLRALGLGVAIAIVVGNVIGAGIFAKPGPIAAAAGSFPLIMAGWVSGGTICLFGALCFAELAAMLPRAGGMYVFLREAYGKPIGFLFGFNEYVFGRTATNGALAVFFAGLSCGFATNAWILAGVACLTILLLTTINIIGVVWGGHVQSLTTIVKAGFLALIALLPFLFLGLDSHIVQWSNYLTTVVPEKKSLAEQFAAVLLAVMWAYNGWHDVAPVAEEVHHPQRNIPLALIGGTLLLMLLYVSVNVAYHGVLSMSQIAGAPGQTAQLTIQRTLQPLGSAWGEWGAYAITAVTMCSVFGALNCNLMMGPRVAFAMARDGIFWRPLARVHPTFRTPAVSLVCQASMSCALVVVGTYLILNAPGLIGEKDLFGLLTDFVVYSANIFYALCVLAVYVLRFRHPDWERPYRTWGYPLVPGLYLAGMGWFLWMAYYAAPFSSGVGLALMALGFPVYGLICVWNRVRLRSSP